MAHVVLLAFADPPAAAGGCGACGGGTGNGCATPAPGAPCATGPVPRAAVLGCRDALVAGGATVDIVTVDADAEIDAVLARLDGPARPDGLTWPAAGGPRLIVASAADGQLRAVLRRMVRRYAPPPSRRPSDLPANRTMPDLPAIGILPLDRARSSGPSGDLADRLDLPRDPAEVAKAALHGRVQRLDLLRHDGGSVTAHGALLAGSAPWSARIEVDDVVLAEATEQVLACAIANADGYAAVDGLPLAAGADPADGLVTAAVAVPVVNRSPWGRRRVRVEVRRVRGRAVSVAPRTEVPYLDDGVAGTLARKRSWWIEPGAWGVFRP
jgi:hypothetical protein